MSDARLSETPAGVRLCRVEEIADGHARGFVLQLRAGKFFGFVVRRGETAIGYVDRCPHAGVGLAGKLDDYLTPGGALIACAWHGALFEVADGRCVAGPCAGARLWPWPVQTEDGWLITAASDQIIRNGPS